MIWSAVLVHLKGRAVAFQISIQSSSAAVSSSREQNTPRSRQRRCSSANHRCAAARCRRHGEDAICFDATKNRYVGAVSLSFGPDGKRSRRKVAGRTMQEVRDKLKALY